jgi:hypothetical protein
MNKYKRKQEEVQCCYCKTIFKKDVSEIKRSLKVGRLHYCSMKCSKSIPSNIEHLKKVGNRDIAHLNPSNRRDEFSDFREHLRRASRRNKSFDLSLQDLKDQWDKQNGLCVYSKVQLIHPTAGSNSHIYTASVDRIDSSLGYVKGNVQFISIAMNHMKANMSDEDMFKLLEILKVVYPT